MSPRILLVTHQADACPGRIGDELCGAGYETVACGPYLGEALPEDLADFSGVVVFGGRMSANDEHLDFIAAELRWIPNVLAAGRSYLGICLGAQLLARALGARVAPHAGGLHEIGFTPIYPTAAGLGVFEQPMHVYQWHGEGFELARGAELLASGQVFAHQAFRLGSAVGLQFHPEVTEKIMRRWTEDVAEMQRPGAQSSRAAHFDGMRRHDPAVARWLRRFLRDWLAPAGGMRSAAA